MENVTLSGIVYDAYDFRGRAFARAFEALPLFHDCGFQSFGTWNDNSPVASSCGKTIAIYIVGAARLTDDIHRQRLTALRRSDPNRLVVAMCDACTRLDIEAAVALDLHGVIASDFPQNIVIAVFQILLEGGRYFPYPNAPEDTPTASFTVLVETPISGAVADARFIDDALVPEELTPRQSDVLEQLRQGHSNKIIARKLGIAEATVKIYVRQLLHKFGAINRTQIVVNAGTALIKDDTQKGLCRTNPARDSSREASSAAGMYGQAHTPRLQDRELAGL